MHAAANLAFRAGKWPIQTLALLTTVVFICYIAVVELKPSAMKTSLARSFLVESPSSWEPLNDINAPAATQLAQFVGAPVVLPSDASPAVRSLLESFGDSSSSSSSHTVTSSDASADTSDYSSNLFDHGNLLLSSHLYSKLLDELRVFNVQGETWELQSAPSFVAYTRFYYARVVELMSKASYFDISVVSAGWAGMYYTFFRLFVQMRHLGSRTFLFLAAIMSSCLAFASAYATTVLLNVSVPKIALVQGLPFFVLAVGFNNKYSLAREALSNPDSDMGAAESVRDAVENQFCYYLRESAILSLGLLCAGFVTRNTVQGLFGFCILSALILAMDLVFLVTFFAANVSLKTAMVRVERNDAVRRALQEDGVSKDVAGAYADEVSHFSARARAAKFTHFRWIGGSVRLLLVFGVMGLNWLHIVRFPVSFAVSRADLSPFKVSDFSSRISTPSILTLVPALRFSRASPASLYINSAVNIMKTAISSPAGILALVLSIVCNVCLAGMVMQHQNSSLVVIPSERASPAAESSARLTSTVSNASDISKSVSKNSAPSSSATSVSGVPAAGDAGAATGATSAAAAAAAAAAGKNATASSNIKEASESSNEVTLSLSSSEVRPIEECTEIYKAGNAPTLNNEELTLLSVQGILPLYALEKQLKDTTRAVVVRRAAVSRLSRTKTLKHSELPYMNYNYDRVLGACCENVVGYLPLPLGVAGPVLIDGLEYYLPMATTEGVLVASTMRGCKALNSGGGVTTEVLADGMTRGPCVTFATAARTAACKIFLDSAEGYKTIEAAFNSTSRFARLTGLKVAQAGMFLYIRFRAQTGDAMGMNMISKGTERALQVLAEECGFDDMTIVSVSGNYCTDKKAAAVNWIEGRGKSVVAEAIVPGDKVKSILKTGVDELVELNMAKNLVGSAVAGVMGGYNAHAANLVAAVFLATGQDPAQVVEGSNCMTLMSNVDGDLQISVTMPSLEVGTIGGGTILEPQAAMLNMLGVRGPHVSTPGENARQLARIIATAVLAGELSLNSALAAGHLVKSHMAHNRAKPAK